jgi:PAS domain S-box-containing protein
MGAEAPEGFETRRFVAATLGAGLSALTRYAIAVTAAALAVLLRLALDPVWGLKVPFITFYPAMMVSAWLGGFGPGIVTTLLCAAAAVLWLRPISTLAVGDVGDLVALLVFISIGVVISLLNEAWRRTAAAVSESEQRRKVTLTSIGDGVITTDPEGRVTLLNEVAQALTGWREAEATGRPLEEIFVIVNEHSRRPAENPVRRVLREGRITGLANHTVLLSKDGREIAIDDSAAPVRGADGSLLGVVMVFRDITERRRFERERAALLQAERAARTEVEAVAEQLRHLQAVTDTALLNLGLDDLLRALLGRVRAALASDTATILLVEPDGRHLVPVASDGLREEVNEHVRIPVGQGVSGQIATSERGLIIDDLTVVDVMSRWLREKVKSLVGAPLRIDHRLIGVIHVGAVAPRQFGEADLALLRLVAERVALAVERAHLLVSEQAARREAEAANRAKDQFLAVLSHELRTPLNTALGWVRMLRSAGVDPPRQERALESIERSTRVQARMIDDLLDMSRIAAGRMTLDRRPMSLGPLITETVESLQEEARGKEVVLETHLDPPAGTVSGDMDRLRQVLMNLLVNAVKYTPSGGRVEVHLTAADDVVRLVVRDTGIGIERDFLPHVFERFRQADWRSAGTQGGLGLGLAIVREIVEMHGGAVEVQSDGPGQGAVFTVTLPVLHGATDVKPSGDA